MKTRVDMKVRLPFSIRKKGDWFVSRCPLLDIFSQGRSRDEAIRNGVEAVSLFLLSCYRRGTLEAVLKECGFQPAEADVEMLSVAEEEIHEVPLPFMVRTRDPGECRA